MALDNRHPHTHDPELRPVERGGGPRWGLLGFVAVIALFAAVIYFMPRAPRAEMAPTAAVSPDQPNAGQLQFTSVNMTESPAAEVAGASQIYVSGAVKNTSDDRIDGIAVDARFRNRQGDVIQTQTQKLLAVKAEDNTGEPVDFAEAPLGFGESRNFRVAFGQIPKEWNKQLPDITVRAVSYVGDDQGAWDVNAGAASVRTGDNQNEKASPGQKREPKYD